MNGKIQEATALINQLHPELLDNDRYLYFHLQVRGATTQLSSDLKFAATTFNRIN